MMVFGAMPRPARSWSWVDGERGTAAEKAIGQVPARPCRVVPPGAVDPRGCGENFFTRFVPVRPSFDARCGWKADRADVPMPMYTIAMIVFATGAVGGSVNAVLTGNHFLLPRIDPGPPRDVMLPGFLATFLVAGLASVLSWGCYSTACGVSFEGKGNLTAGVVAGAVLVGFWGARALTSEVDKKLWRKAASLAASMPASATIADALLSKSPMKAVTTVRQESPGLLPPRN